MNQRPPSDSLVALERYRRVPVGQAPAGDRFKLTAFNDVSLGASARFLVKNLLTATGLAVVYGAPKCGKSFLVFDLVMHVALGRNYRGRRTKSGSVVYLALEGAEGFRARIAAFRQEKLGEHRGSVPFYLIDSPLTLVVDHRALLAAICAQLPDARPAVVVIDTLNRSLAGSESDDRDMGAYIRAADAIREQLGCLVLVVHHSGLDTSRPRGHTSLTGAADVQIAVKRDTAGNIVATVEWLKDGAAGDEIVSRLAPVEVGKDEDGEAMTSCVIEAVDASCAIAKPMKTDRTSKAGRIALRAFHEAMGRAVDPPTTDQIPRGVKAIMVDDWRAVAIARGVSTSEKPDSARAAFRRAMQELVTTSQVAVWDVYAWPTK